MSYSSQTPPDSSSNSGSSSSASQYATAALGVGLLVLGIVMILWSVVPVGSGVNNSQNTEDKVRPNTSSVGFVLLGTGVAMLLLSLFLGIQNKYRAQRQANGNANTEQGQGGDRQPDDSEQYTVPSYEDVVGNTEYPISQFSPRQNSTTCLPAYDELMETGQGETEGPCAHKNGADNLNSTHIVPKKNPGLKLLPLKVRTKSSSSSPQVMGSSIEPLTPPPQYEENPPELPPGSTVTLSTLGSAM
ncbi:transmembrane protein 51a [Silurus meridionalis]|uniref:Transmembrane protein 51 n=1 Tax=Silurus meridionalis TaxID=175797 RepID=A0A8T0ATB1_SILME|nr:transmembrane protein 51a [Silurus meridionalis]XP_046727992.1 transmembrane protein 51a [Silurus meridionalis]KAF7695426.1 hypothetical protein HF521_007149 [Silurus meridionalis]KAI5095116.1 transmembrane protein 51a [Silurus meridionalis]